ncbi:MAG: hypothetical protein K2Y18_05780 [Alphaproteobacteria bacterium]|nr:hypothetical protein [Alphaproteobacteria bacterium]
MFQHFLLIMVCVVVVACAHRDTIEPVKKIRYPNSYTNIASPPAVSLEKPNMDEEFYDVPKV